MAMINDVMDCCYKWHIAFVTGAMRAVMHGVSCNDGRGKPTMGPDDNGGSGG